MKKRPIELVDLPEYCRECDEKKIDMICHNYAVENNPNPDDEKNYNYLYRAKYKTLDVGYCYECE
jgi:hypothetical protein